MEIMKRAKLQALVVEFATAVAPLVKVDYSDDNEPVYLTVEEMLTVWMQFPDSTYSAMFLGWILAKGEDINSVSPETLGASVQIAAVGDNKNVMFDWYGEDDASDKSH